MKTIKYRLTLILISVLLFAGCTKEVLPDKEEEKQQVPALIQKINTFIKDVMTDVYLWYDKMPVIDLRYENDSKAYFYKLLYREDEWSYITDDIITLENSLQGIEKTFGYSLAFVLTGDASGSVYGIVEYVYPDTPASRAGFARGDIIIKLNGANITVQNYMYLLIGPAITVTKGILNNDGIVFPGSEVSMSAEELTLDPVLIHKIIEREGYKIGYLLYLQFIASYDTASLRDAFQYFSDNQITDLVLDLRYNPGGQISAAMFLCSSIAPLDIVNNNSTLVTFQWNSKYQNYWITNNVQSQLGINFDSGVPVKLGLGKVHILTGYGTASASELAICGLEPYMDVTLVGDTTYGKYTGSFIIKPEDLYTNESEYTGFKNWGLMPVVIRYANSQGLTNFKNGFKPDFYVRDELLPAYPLGELSEPLLKKAVENITGTIITEPKGAKVPFEYNIVNRASSKFDQQKQNLIIEVPRDLQKIPE